MRARIGITMNYRVGARNGEEALLDSRYLDYIADAGAVPIPIMPTLDRELVGLILDCVGGVLFTGGLDLDPARWGEQRHEATKSLHPHREQCEMLLYEEVYERRLAIMGICLGIQVINVAHGGTLHQHVPDVAQEVEHQVQAGKAMHQLELVAGTRLHDWLGMDETAVNSYHHQCINRVGDGLVVSGRDESGLVEAVEQVDYPFLLGVQWHPERDVGERVNRVIVARFVEAAMVAQTGGTDE